MTYAGIVAGQVGAGFAFRTARESLLRVGPFSNRLLLVGIAFELALLVAILYVPALHRVFHTGGLDPRAWSLLALWPLLARELLGAGEDVRVLDGSAERLARLPVEPREAGTGCDDATAARPPGAAARPPDPRARLRLRRPAGRRRRDDELLRRLLARRLAPGR